MTTPALSLIDLALADSQAAQDAAALARTNVHTSPAAHAALHPGEEMARARATLARGKLSEYIRQGQARGQDAARRVFAEVPTDALAPAAHLNFAPLRAGSMGVALGVDGEPRPLHRHALQQAAERLGVPFKYLADMANSDDDWRRDFAASALNEHAVHSGERYLVRSAGGAVRGILSDKYRRLDSRPLLEAFAVEAERAGLVISDGVAADVRTSLKVVAPEVIELPGGDFGVFGLEWANSDYGAGRFTISGFMLRLLCLNGMVGANALGAVHLGRRISDAALVSQRTVDLDTQTMVSATRDVVRGALEGGSIRELLMARVAGAAEAKVTGDPIKGRLLTSMSTAEQRRARELFSGPEVVMLPAEPTRWRLSQTISWMANESPDALRKLELERLAGEMLDSTRAREVVLPAYAGGTGEA